MLTNANKLLYASNYQ
jgi:tetratricopeptide (TPR) repeat protein